MIASRCSPCRCQLGLVIPLFNEAESIPSLLRECRRLQLRLDVHVVLVDNGSLDNSYEILKDSVEATDAISVLRLEENMGYGGGILAGLAEAPGRALAWTHADLQTPISDVGTAFSLLDSEPRSLVKGFRRNRKPSALALTFGMSVIESVLFGRVLRDINGQPTAFSRDFFDSWTNPPEDFTLDLYSMIMARRQGREIRRFDVDFLDRNFGQSSWNKSTLSRLQTIRRTLRSSVRLRLGMRWS